MKIVDVNVLLYAINKDTPHHKPLLRWWEKAMGGDEPVGLSWAVVMGFIRLATHPKIFSSPLTPRRATRQVAEWVSNVNVQFVGETESHWEILRGLLDAPGTTGNLTSDAHLAALAIGRNATLVSCDADFSRFPGLRWENPLRAA